MVLCVYLGVLSRKIRAFKPVISIQIMCLIVLPGVADLGVAHHKLLQRKPELHRRDVARPVPAQRREELHGLRVRYVVAEGPEELHEHLSCERPPQRPVPQPHELVLPLLRPDGLVVHRLRVEPPRVKHRQPRRLQHVLYRWQLQPLLIILILLCLLCLLISILLSLLLLLLLLLLVRPAAVVSREDLGQWGEDGVGPHGRGHCGRDVLLLLVGRCAVE